MPVLGQQLGQPPTALKDAGRAILVQNTAPAVRVDTDDRAAVIQLYETVYKASEGVPIGWNGSVPDCQGADTSQAFKEATLLRVNYFRAMAGLPGDVLLDEAWSAKCQQAALMMSAQGQLSHTPTDDWPCYSAEGSEAAARSNLSMGSIGPSAVDDFIDDPGSANSFVGHRRWILYPPQQRMGTGSVPASGDEEFPFRAVSVLWVTTSGGERLPGPEFVAWPPPGYVPYPVLPRRSRRWSVSMPGANFSRAEVLMQSSGTNIPVSYETARSGYGDNTLVWRPAVANGGQIGATYAVTVSGVLSGGESRSLSYAVTVIDPASTELRIEARLEQGNLQLNWPAQTQPYLLEQTNSPSGQDWQPVLGTPRLEQGQHTVSLPIKDHERYYRLRRE